MHKDKRKRGDGSNAACHNRHVSKKAEINKERKDKDKIEEVKRQESKMELMGCTVTDLLALMRVSHSHHHQS